MVPDLSPCIMLAKMSGYFHHEFLPMYFQLDELLADISYGSIPGTREHLLEEGRGHRGEYRHLDEEVLHLGLCAHLGVADQADHAAQEALVLVEGDLAAVEVPVDVREAPVERSRMFNFNVTSWRESKGLDGWGSYADPVPIQGVLLSYCDPYEGFVRTCNITST